MPMTFVKSSRSFIDNADPLANATDHTRGAFILVDTRTLNDPVNGQTQAAVAPASSAQSSSTVAAARLRIQMLPSTSALLQYRAIHLQCRAGNAPSTILLFACEAESAA